MKLPPQRLKPCSANHYLIRKYGSYAEQRSMQAAVKRLQNALKGWR